jgi:hypothetical protein
MPDRVVRRLDHILGLEHAAITQGAFEVLPALSEEKEALLIRLPKAQSTPEEIARISRLIGRNQSLLAAALQGVEAAQKSLQALRKIAQGSNVYDRSGTVSRLLTGGKDLPQKL